MITQRPFAFAVLAIPLTLAFTVVADDLAFRPAKDAKAQKELRIEGEFRIKDASFSMNGEPAPTGALDELTSQEMLLSLAIDATETFLATKDGVPIDLLRTYDKIEVSMEVGDETQSPDDSNELEGKTVRFQRDEKSELKKSFHESKGDDALLESLIDDMEVRALLPEKKVSAGDTWDVAADRMQALFFPGGIVMSGKDESGGPDIDALGQEMADQLEEAWSDFKVACTYKGAREDGGTRVGEITFLYDGKATLDLASLLEKVTQSVGGGAEMPEMDIQATASMTLKGEGVLLWDLATGTLHSYEMKADVGLDIDIEVSMDQGGQQMEFAVAGSLGGDVTWDLSRK